MRSILLITLLAAILGGGGAYAWLYYGGFGGEGAHVVSFIDTYGDYEEVATRVETLTHVPGVSDNPDRGELEQLLTTMLTERVSAEERGRYALLARSNLNTLQGELDAAQASQAKLYEVLQTFDNASAWFHGIEARSQAEDIVAMARKRAETSARITSIQSEIYIQTDAIIAQILADGGALTQEHITVINNATDNAEARHATLTGLYDDLVRQKSDMETAFANFVHSAL